MAVPSSEKALVRIVVAGHVDHGKSTLIGRIRHDICALVDAAALDGSVGGNWAFAMDQLQEERERMMTIDTTQTFLETPTTRIVFIDVPGHQELIQNMITGATRADHAVLVLAADEGVQVQTRRHALVLSLIGVRGVVVVTNKMDAVNFAEAAFRELETAIVGHLGELGIEAYAVIPAVALNGDNVLQRSLAMPWYDGPTLMEVLADLEPVTHDEGAARFPVQDVYEHDGERIVVGRLLAGRIAEGDVLTAMPPATTVRVVEVRRFPADHLPVTAGESVGFVVDGSGPARGIVLASPGDLPMVADRVAARVFWLAEQPLAVGESLTLRCATQDVPVAVASISERMETVELGPLPPSDRLAAMELATVEVSADRPIVFEPFARVAGLGRFVLERNGLPVGFGVVSGGAR
jgi:bifunctional enzyme CysN/CysC